MDTAGPSNAAQPPAADEVADLAGVDVGFETLEAQAAAGDAKSLLAGLAQRLRDEKRYHELFDALLLATRHRLGLPIVLTAPLDDLPESERNQVETAYLDACREIGLLLLGEGDVRSAWHYLRPLGDKSLVARQLERLEPNEENLEDIIEIALHQAVAPSLGFRLVLEHFGVCNAITAFDSSIAGLRRADRQAPAAMLVRRLHADLLESLAADIRRREQSQVAETSIPRLLEDREWLFLNNNYHIDTTHLAAVVRFARAIDDPATLRLAVELTEYGRRLARQFQFVGDEPFVDAYATHALFFGASLASESRKRWRFSKNGPPKSARKSPWSRKFTSVCWIGLAAMPKRSPPPRNFRPARCAAGAKRPHCLSFRGSPMIIAICSPAPASATTR